MESRDAEAIVQAARRILEGDTSMAAAAALESALLLEPGHRSEADDELIYALSLYRPGAPAPYVGPAELAGVIRDALDDGHGRLRWEQRD